jgi:hypothetical protein
MGSSLTGDEFTDCTGCAQTGQVAGAQVLKSISGPHCGSPGIGELNQPPINRIGIQ